MNKIDEIEGIEIFKDGSGFDGFFIRIEDVRFLNKQLTQKLQKWSGEHHRAYCVADIFIHLGYRFSDQFLKEEDLDVIIRFFPNSILAVRASQEKEQMQAPALAPVQKSERGKSRGHVYVIKGERGAYKIGKTNNLDNRLKLFHVKLPFDIHLIHAIPSGDIDLLEKELHQKYDAQRINGEWFELSDEDIEEIKKLEQTY